MKSKILEKVGFGFIIFIVLMFVLGFFLTVYIQEFSEFLASEYGLVGIFIGSFVLDTLLQPVGPDVPLILGIVNGEHSIYIILILVLLGSYLSGYFCVYIGRKFGSKGVKFMLGKKKYKKFMENQHYGKWALFIGSLSPVPYIPYLGGIYHLSHKEIWLIMFLPRTIRFIFVALLAVWFTDSIVPLIVF
ncbi:MAG: YqaA family protein [Candidatus Woesearchaeota archaeon]